VPLLTLEYTANISQDVPLPNLFATLHQVLSDLTGISLDNFKSRAVRRDHFHIGAGQAGNAFAHLEIRILLYLYEKLGYSEFRRERLTDKVTLVFMEKQNR
jgi:5-carboxymethyl-2-hydroxymuconate isomerase